MCKALGHLLAGHTQHENNLSQRKIKSNLNGSNIFGIMEISPDMGSSSHRGLIIAQDQKANGKFRDIFSFFDTTMVC